MPERSEFAGPRLAGTRPFAPAATIAKLIPSPASPYCTLDFIIRLPSTALS